MSNYLIFLQKGKEYEEIASSEVWYEERTDFSRAAAGTDRISHKEVRGYELLQGKKVFEGRLLGGCLESLYDILTTTRYADEKAVCEKYGIFPPREEWTGKILKVDEISVIADYLVIANGRNQNQLNAMTDLVEEKMIEAGYKSKRIEGNKNSSWVLMDYGDVIVHVFSKEDRLFYDLERIWKDGKKISREEL